MAEVILDKTARDLSAFAGDTRWAAGLHVSASEVRATNGKIAAWTSPGGAAAGDSNGEFVLVPVSAIRLSKQVARDGMAKVTMPVDGHGTMSHPDGNGEISIEFVPAGTKAPDFGKLTGYRKRKAGGRVHRMAAGQLKLLADYAVKRGTDGLATPIELFVPDAPADSERSSACAWGWEIHVKSGRTQRYMGSRPVRGLLMPMSEL